ncbi:lipid IV(A) 3-deoxy-D-manno-octulosonic acid transferase [Halomonas sp. M20]|uniref:lipid IV(A) 3-deoxy-D-manno-octulosonic acid transferase n=1 Tax=Halomonas sp. M20 TaxID=2763264 RepID=UPI001D0B7878|nr:lipid IV(A) 3-deoxy-D-manno-octulosonic acid transferase [Halomonas sp. M20]
MAKRESTAAQRHPWARWLYSLVLYLLSPLLWWRLWREWVPTNPRSERLGLIKVSTERPRLWLHAASVGEVQAARPLIESFRARYPDHQLVVTTMTATGAERVTSLFRGEVSHYFVPLDFPGAARRFISRLQPEIAIFFETELWPNLLHACHQRRIPVAVVNGRLSSKALRGYLRIRALMADALGKIDWLAAKSEQDAARFRRLGMATSKTTVVGSLKFDISLSSSASTDSEHLRTMFSVRPVWIAASTHSGEDEQMLVAHARLREIYPSALLILVPRHPQRFDNVTALCQRGGETLARRSLNETVRTDTTVYLGDTMGELMTLYGAADIAFVGGSLVPIGGHNLLEPAAQGVPVLSGPELANFEDVATVLREARALVEVASAQALGEALITLMENPDERRRQGAAGRAAIAANVGALQRTLEGLDRLLGKH